MVTRDNQTSADINSEISCRTQEETIPHDERLPISPDKLSKTTTIPIETDSNEDPPSEKSKEKADDQVDLNDSNHLDSSKESPKKSRKSRKSKLYLHNHNNNCCKSEKRNNLKSKPLLLSG